MIKFMYNLFGESVFAAHAEKFYGVAYIKHCIHSRFNVLRITHNQYLKTDRMLSVDMQNIFPRMLVKAQNL